MGTNKETPEDQRERMRQQEWKDKTPTGNLNDSFHRGSHGNLIDLVGSLGWKGTGMLILVLLLGYIIYALFFR